MRGGRVIASEAKQSSGEAFTLDCFTLRVRNDEAASLGRLSLRGGRVIASEAKQSSRGRHLPWIASSLRSSQ
ncbi:MAG: hypothetical protein LBT00_05300 [Spirochaetaceae bacterium]|nr:hypothetical protein [Spirochaetaceae bacterium]